MILPNGLNVPKLCVKGVLSQEWINDDNTAGVWVQELEP